MAKEPEKGPETRGSTGGRPGTGAAKAPTTEPPPAPVVRKPQGKLPKR